MKAELLTNVGHAQHDDTIQRDGKKKLARSINCGGIEVIEKSISFVVFHSVVYLNGGIDSGFKSVELETYMPPLLRPRETCGNGHP